MQSSVIVKLLKALGAENIEVKDEWVDASCPFAPYPGSGHSHGSDTKPSFGIKIGKKSHYYCFACDKGGPVSTLVTSLCFLSGKDNIKARRIIMANEDHSLDEYEQIEEPEPLTTIPEAVYKQFAPLTKDIIYAKRRGITPEVAKHWGIRFDPYRRRLVFPVRNSEGHLVGVRGRTTCEALPKVLEYDQISSNRPKSHGIWFGQQFTPPAGKKIILVEGEIDALSLWRALKRPGIWASMGASVSRSQLTTLQEHRQHQFILFFDNDKAGLKAKDKVKKALISTAPLYEVTNYSGGHDPDEIVMAGKLREALESITRMT